MEKTRNWWNKGEGATRKLVSVDTDELQQQRQTSLMLGKLLSVNTNEWGGGKLVSVNTDEV